MKVTLGNKRIPESHTLPNVTEHPTKSALLPLASWRIFRGQTLEARWSRSSIFSGNNGRTWTVIREVKNALLEDVRTASRLNPSYPSVSGILWGEVLKNVWLRCWKIAVVSWRVCHNVLNISIGTKTYASLSYNFLLALLVLPPSSGTRKRWARWSAECKKKERRQKRVRKRSPSSSRRLIQGSCVTMWTWKKSNI